MIKAIEPTTRSPAPLLKPKPVALNGILLLNKPTGLTSNAVLQQAKRLFNAKKAGHTGSLDPLATGMLPICFGEATKFCQYLLDADKCYEVTGRLGIKTDSADAMGTITAQVDEFNITLETLQQVLSQFLGPIKQVPSMFSALKHQGRPLYKYARAGIDVPREAREVMIHALELQQFDGQSLSLRVTCSKGTYIRNLIEDIGDILGVGAHVTRLHRCYTAGFANDELWDMALLQQMSIAQLQACLLPLERAVMHFPRLDLSDEAVEALYVGKTVPVNPTNTTGCVRLYKQNTTLIGLGHLQPDGLLKSQRLLAPL